ncbi:MAG: acetate--CoA ligase family protein [Acidobacteria bacterium]|nr:acetate--CoA ligase family protein [Acidobacteriota bacterium]
MLIDSAAIATILRKAETERRGALLETEGFGILTAMGIRVPRQVFVRGRGELKDSAVPAGERVVLKVVSPAILHKSEAGGVQIVANDSDVIVAAIEQMSARFGEIDVRGYTISEYIPYDPSLGNELLIGARWTAEFGPVVTFGAGGIFAEFLAKSFRPGSDSAILSARLVAEDEIMPCLEQAAISRLVFGGLRGQSGRVDPQAIAKVVADFCAFANAFMPDPIAELEINPMVLSSGHLVALDVRGLLSHAVGSAEPARPVAKIRNLLQPRSIAIVGVSEKLNPGHIILNNILGEGFDRDRIYVVKQGSDTIEGCQCYPDIEAMPGRVDLFILSVSAAQTPGIITRIVEGRWAESLIVISGGLEEKQGTEAIVARMRGTLARARVSDWHGPLINGGNCLGIRSGPGHYDTLFIPKHKLPAPAVERSPLAIISSSGAFAIARMNKLPLNPRYLISLGNQMDLTLGDYLSYLADDAEIEVFSVYAEGFRPLDGLRFLEAARRITATGRTVILYRAGRTAAGAKASASHTAAIAGDYAVTRVLAEQAGVVMAETIADFEDLTKIFVLLRDRRVAGLRLAAVSNAGFECVAMADNLHDFSLARFGKETVSGLEELFRRCHLEEIVDLHNPVDLTPIMDDGATADAIRAVLLDANVDIVVIGCVPLTGALNTLPPSNGHGENIHNSEALAMRMAAIRRDISKPWVAIVDGGAIYDPMVKVLEENAIPTFRTADRALRLFNRFCAARVRALAQERSALGSLAG